MQPYVTNLAQPCPVCNADPRYRRWSQFTQSQYTHVISPRHTVLGSTITPLVCTQCGYVQLFVNPEDFLQDKQ